jgi:transposase
MTFLAARRCDRLDAPCVLDQPINAQSFTDYVEQCLVPTLAPGDVVIMDKLSSHKTPAIRRAVRAVGARLLVLPPYSPDLKPIEQVFAKLKRPPNDPMRQLGAASARSSTPPPQTNAATASRNSGYASA